MKFQGSRREEPDVSMTPFIDVVFLLLIFFMVTTTFNRETEISINLPESSGEALKTEHKVVEVSIDAKGRFFVNQQEVINSSLDAIKAAMAKAAGDDKKPQVILSADRHTEHQAVITAMDAARQLGFVHLTFATSKRAAEK